MTPARRAVIRETAQERWARHGHRPSRTAVVFSQAAVPGGTDDCPTGLGALSGVAGGCHLPQRILARAFAVVLAGTAFFLLTGALALVVVANTSVWRGATPKLIPSSM